MGESKHLQKQLEDLPAGQLQAMAAAGAEVEECFRVLGKADSNPVAEVISHYGTFYEWDHYPPGDAVDWETHSQFYYHAHPKEERPGEHGHFHTFLRFEGMPEEAKPLPLEHPQKDNEDRIGAHLIAISMDNKGKPIKLFTVNRWVTDEVWYPADEVISFLDRFEMDHTYPSWATNRLLTAILRLFKPQIIQLVRERDTAIEKLMKKNPKRDVFEDRNAEVLSETRISVNKQIAAINRILQKRQSGSR